MEMFFFGGGGMIKIEKDLENDLLSVFSNPHKVKLIHPLRQKILKSPPLCLRQMFYAKKKKTLGKKIA